jgi:hypothetical protein
LDDELVTGWEKLTHKALIRIWDDEILLNNAKMFMEWYEPGSELIRVGNARLFYMK